ncbi:hypothetical protein ACA910_013660 [Epithemia clementina (nom. ined.)]
MLTRSIARILTPFLNGPLHDGSYSVSTTALASSTNDLDLVRGFESICLHGGYVPDPATLSRGVPIHRTAAYALGSTERAANLFALKEFGNIYSRLMNPTTDVLEQRVSMMEGGVGAVAVASGTMAIFNAIVNLAEQGDNFISARNLYGGTYTQFNDILPNLGITAKFVDITDPVAVLNAIDDKTRAIFCETVSNPALEVSPLQELGAIAKDAGIPLIVDDTFTTPYLTRPFEHGANIVVNSLTKWTGGHGVGIGGIVVDGGNFNWGAGKHRLYTAPDTSYGGMRWGLDLPPELSPMAYILRLRTVPLRNLGGCISPDNSWMFLQGIETLPLRMERHCENALKVAEHLASHPSVEWVRYPGMPGNSEYVKNLKYLKGKGGSVVVFEIKGGAPAGKAFIEKLKLHSHLANVGDAKSLAIHPATTTHSQMNKDEQRLCGITPGLVRLSVGLETMDDILEDLNQALES